MRLSTRQLEYLVAVARYGHFGRAASACGVSQPGLSVQVRLAERQLGVQLFERRRRGVTITGAGQRVLERARRVLEELDALHEEAQAVGAPLAGPMRLGVIPTVAPYLLPRVLPRVREQYPGMQLYLREDLTARLVEQLRQGRLDLLVSALPAGGAGTEEMPLYDEPFDLLVPSGHPLARRGSVALSGLGDAPVLLLEDGHCLRDQALAVCRASGASEAEGLRGTSLGTLAQMVAGGMGVTLLPRLARDAEGKGEAVEVKRLAAPVPRRTVGLVWRRSSLRAADYRLLGELIRDTASEALSRRRPEERVERLKS